MASVQFESRPGDKEANFSKIESFTALAAAQGVQLLVFPECCVTGYWFIRNLTLGQLAALAEPIPDGPSTRRLVELARQHNITIGAGWVEAGGGGVYHNSYVVALPDDTMVIADLDARLLQDATGRNWIRARRPELYTPLTVPTGLECDTRTLKFEE